MRLGNFIGEYLIYSRSHCLYLKKFLAYVKIKQDIETGLLYQNKEVLERARNMSLDYNFVTELTSLVVRIDDGARNSQKKIFKTGGSGNGTQGMSTPIETYLNLSSLIWPEKNTTYCGPCNITVYSRELYMGDGLTFCTSVPELSFWEFEEKLESVKVEGTCGWRIFTGEILSLSVSLIVYKVDMFR